MRLRLAVVVVLAACVESHAAQFIVRNVPAASAAVVADCALSPGTGPTHTVGAGKEYATPSACAAAASAGWICDIYTGSYGGFTSPSGSAGQPITYQAHTGETVTMTGSITVTDKQYVLIKNLNWNGGGVLYSLDDTVGGPHTTAHIDLCGASVVNALSAGSGFQSAVQLFCGGGSCVLEHLTIDHTGVDLDFFDVGGPNFVIRDATLVNANGTVGEPHVDGIQEVGSTPPVLTNSLFENVVEKNCTAGVAGNCHFVQIRSVTGTPAASLIFRYLYNYGMSSGGIGLQPTESGVPNARLYNITISNPTGGTDPNGADITYYSNSKVFNNISYDTSGSTTGSPIYGNGSGSVQNGNIYFKPSAPSATWGAPATGEATFATLKNLDPLFSNYPTTCVLSAGSPARNAGVDLTTVASGDAGSGTTLTLNDVRFFQPGWAGVQGDWIRVGGSTSSPTTQITGIDYAGATVTISPAITRSVGDPVNLYKLTDGTIVLTTAKPIIGGCWQ